MNISELKNKEDEGFSDYQYKGYFEDKKPLRLFSNVKINIWLFNFVLYVSAFLFELRFKNSSRVDWYGSLLFLEGDYLDFILEV